LTVLVAIAVIVLVSGFLRFYRLSTPRDYVFDEVYYAKDAATIIKGDLGPRQDYHWMPGDEVSWPHAEYGKLAIALGVLAFGDTELGWRFMPAVAGLVLLLFVYPIARRLGLSREWSLAALALAAADFLGLAQSRIATLDIFVALWTAVTVYLALRYVQDGRRWYWLVLAGVAGGLAVGSKWSGLWGLLAAIVIVAVFRPGGAEPGASPPSSSPRLPGWLKEAPLVVACLVIVPALVYLASYALYFSAGHTLGDWWELQNQMWTFNTNLTATHPYASAAATWILDYRPVWYHFSSAGNVYHGVIAMGNPFLWWSSCLALVALPLVAIHDRNRALVLPSVLVAVLYFLWFVFGRTSFLFYMAPVAPFMAILVAAGLARLARRPPQLTRAGSLMDHADAAARSRNASLLQPALVFMASAVLVALLWYPIGVGVRFAFYDVPALIAPAVGIAVASLAAVAALVGLGALAGSARFAPFWRVAGWIFVGACAGIMMAFLPIILDLGITKEAWTRLMWLPSWI